MADKLKSFVQRWKYELIIFLMTMVPVIINIEKLTHIHRMFIQYYLYDFSMGINSRVLIGSIVNLLNPHPTEEWIRGFALVFLVSGMLLTAIVLAGVIKKADAENRLTIFVFILFFVSGAYTISIFSRFFGMLDIHMYILALLSVVFLQNKYLRWLIPFLCAAGVFINYVFIMSYFPFVLLAMFYAANRSSKKSVDIILIIITLIIVALLTFYCVFHAGNYMFVTFEEAIEIMENKIGQKFDNEQNEYAGIYLFNVHEESENMYGVKVREASPFELIYYFIRFLYENRIGVYGIITLAIITVPVIAFFFTIWIMCIRSSEKKSSKFVYFCCILSTICIPVCCLLSTDFIRWIGAGFMCQFAMCFFLFYKKDEAFDKTVGRIRAVFSKNKFVPVIVYFVYVSSAYLYLGT